MSDYVHTPAQDNIAIDINPKFHVDLMGAVNTIGITDASNLFVFDSKRTITLDTSKNNLALAFNGFNEYVVMGNSEGFAKFIAKAHLTDEKERELAKICRDKINEGAALVYGSIDYYNLAEKQVVGECLPLVIYTVYPNQNTYQLLPIQTVFDYIEETYINAFAQSLVNIPNGIVTEKSALFKKPFNHIGHKNKWDNLFTPKKIAAAAALAFLVPVALASVQLLHKDKSIDDDSVSALASKKDQQTNDFKASKNPTDALKAIAKEPVMLVNEKGGVKQADAQSMANLQVATTEEYLKKMGVDINAKGKNGDLSCLD